MLDLTVCEGHTKGSWYRNIRPATKYPTIFAGRNTHIAVIKTIGLDDAEIEANIELIVAAPDLLAENKLLRKLIELLEGKLRSRANAIEAFYTKNSLMENESKRESLIYNSKIAEIKKELGI